MLQNPVAFLLFRPLRLLFVAVTLLVGYAATMTIGVDVEEATVCDASDVSRVELLR